MSPQKKREAPPAQRDLQSPHRQDSLPSAQGKATQRPPFQWWPSRFTFAHRQDLRQYRMVMILWVSTRLPGATWPEVGSDIVALTNCLHCNTTLAAQVDVGCVPAEVRCCACRVAAELPEYLAEVAWPASPVYGGAR